MRNIIRFVQHFISYWGNYPSYRWFVDEHMTEEQRELCRKSDEENGIKPHDKNRFDYAWNLTMIWWKHRDRYSEKCTGECEECTCKNC